jgi:very-short-patch-repair endonuclease
MKSRVCPFPLLEKEGWRDRRSLERRGGQFGATLAQDQSMSKVKRGIYNTKAKEAHRRELRNSSTAAEAILWKHLQRRQVLAKKFRRQESIGPYIVDFYCPECRLAVELDGAGHYSTLGNEYDERRDKYLETLGIQVVRFENRLVYQELEFVLETIRRNLLTKD